jgi:uncharacterized protein (TIGR00369 family)
VTDEKATAAVRELMPLAVTLGIRVDAYAADEVVMSLDWAPALCTANGVLHGGVIMALADSAGAACALLNLPEGASGTTTVESKTNFMGAVRSGSVSARATPLHRGGTTVVIETVARDEHARLIAKVTQTQLLLRPRG